MPLRSSFLCVGLTALLAIPAHTLENRVEALALAGVIPTGDDPAGSTVEALPDQPLEEYRARLLELAFQAASAMPRGSQLKPRSRIQEEVVMAWLELGQLRRAQVGIEGIDNWRRGACYAELAYQCARLGHHGSVQELLDRAVGIARSSEDAEMQDWRRDRILAKIAKTHAWVGREAEARAIEADLADAEQVELQVLKAQLVPAGDVRRQLELLDGLVAQGGFDQSLVALRIARELFGLFYADRELREVIEERIHQYWVKLPVQVRIETLERLIESTLAYQDDAKALELLHQARLLIEGHAWLPEDRVVLTARLAVLRFRAGDPQRARREVDTALGFFEQNRVRIESMYRAGALRPIAEAYDQMGDRSAALRTFKLSLEESLENPNSRPRANDFVALCVSMARHAIEPDQALSARLAEVLAKELREPW